MPTHVRHYFTIGDESGACFPIFIYIPMWILCGIYVDSLFLSTYLCGNFVVFTYQSDFLPLVTSYIITFIITPFGLQYYIFV
jgi:hypothetical protein